MELRSEFASFVMERAGAPEEKIPDRCIRFELPDCSEHDTDLAREFDRTGKQWLQWKAIADRGVERLHEARIHRKEAQERFELRCVENLYCSLTSKRPYRFDQSVEKAARKLIEAAESVMQAWLGWGECEVVEAHGIFAIHLHREPRTAWEVEHWGILEPRPCAIMYVDALAGSDFGVAYLEPLIPAVYWHSRTA